MTHRGVQKLACICKAGRWRARAYRIPGTKVKDCPDTTTAGYLTNLLVNIIRSRIEYNSRTRACASIQTSRERERGRGTRMNDSPPCGLIVLMAYARALLWIIINTALLARIARGFYMKGKARARARGTSVYKTMFCCAIREFNSWLPRPGCALNRNSN